MRVVIHRGARQIGGMATEISTASARIIIDMGDELSLEENHVPAPLSIPGVTDCDGRCDGIFLTHSHRDHMGQLKGARRDIPLYMGAFSKDLLLATLTDRDEDLKARVAQARPMTPGKAIQIGDISVTPFSIDHSAPDSYMFLIEANGRRILHTGDFRLHGFRGKGMIKLLDSVIGRIDCLIIEGTTLSRPDFQPMTENQLQRRAREYMAKYKYVFVLCASTNLERVCALSKAVPRGKYFVCDEYQYDLLKLVERHWGGYSPLYCNIKKTKYGDNLLPALKEKGFLMAVRDNKRFRQIIQLFDPEESIILYSMWDGYRTRPGSGIPEFLSLAGHWEPLHTSGHASPDDLRLVVDKCRPGLVIPVHSDSPDRLEALCPGVNIALPLDGETVAI